MDGTARSPQQLMGYAGLVPSEYTTGSRRRMGAITRTGNAHLRRVVIEAARAYRFGPAVRGPLRARQAGLEPAITEIAWRAQKRLPDRYRTLAAKGKNNNQVIPAVGREFLGFIWDTALTVEQQVPLGATVSQTQRREDGSRSGREKENPHLFCAAGRSASSTRVLSPRQLPTDHDDAVSNPRLSE